MLKPLLLLLLLLLPGLGHGQTLLTGTVRDSEGAPPPAVIVRAYAQGAKEKKVGLFHQNLSPIHDI